MDSPRRHKKTAMHHRSEKKDRAVAVAAVDDDDDDAVATESNESEERRLKRRLRRAKKMAKHLENLGLDEEGNELDNFSLAKYPVREWKFTIAGMRDEVAINPVTTLIAIVWLWGIVLWCAVNSSHALETLGTWHAAISLNLAWLTQATKAAYLFFMLWIAYKYGHIKLGSKEDKPEFSTLTYSSMIYIVCVSNSLFLSSVSEPLSQQGGHFYSNSGYRSQDEIDLFAINITLTNWGLGGWATGTVVAVATSLAVYRFKLPMTFRSCFYPILGKYTWGWIGDAIDGLAIVATLAGVCTSLGMSGSNFLAGFAQLKWIDEDMAAGQVTAIQNSVVWVLSMLSLASAISGLYGGIKLSCLAAAGLAFVLMLYIFAMDDTKYILNLQVQEAGTYVQSSIFQLNLWTDAFGQLRQGSGRAVDGKAAEQLWCSYWINFFQLWWAAACAGLGLFVASISRGRYVGEVILHCLILPVVYSLVWFCVFGGVGLRQSRQSLELESLGMTLFNNSAHFMTDGNELCFDVPQEDIVVDGEVVFTNYLPGVTPVCKFDTENTDSAAFNVMNSFTFEQSFQKGGYGPGLSLLFMLGCAVTFMASAGAMSLIVDKMASTGRKNDHLARRVFWLVTAAVLATALLSIGGEDAMYAIQSALVMCGLPISVLLCYVLQSIYLMCERAAKTHKVADYQFPKQAEFTMPVYGGILNVFEYCASFGKVDQARLDDGMGRTTKLHVVEFTKGLVAPFATLRNVLAVTHPHNPKANLVVACCYALSYVGWIGVAFASFHWPGLAGSVWTTFVIHGGILAAVRKGFRTRHDIRSNVVADVICSAFFWPQVLSQMNLFASASDVATTDLKSTSETAVFASKPATSDSVEI